MGKVEIIERINNALKSFSKEGFTVPIHGEPQRYIIGLTDNKAKSIDFPLVKKLASQARALSKEFSDSLTIWGWYSSERKSYFIDIGTTKSSLYQAIELAIKYKQEAIWDSIRMEEIRVSYS